MGEILAWLGTQLPSLGASLGLAGAGLVWTLLLFPAGDDHEEAQALVVAGILVMLACLIGSMSSGIWAPWIPYLAGIAVIPAIWGISVGISKLGSVIKRGWVTLKKAIDEDHKRALAKQAAAENARKERLAAEAKMPKAVIARCEAACKRYIAALPQDLQVIEERRQAETKLDALRGLYKLLEAIEKLGPENEESFRRRLADADSLFSDVSLEGECGALVRELRERSVEQAPPVTRIHAAIEALVLSIESLPGRAAARIAQQTPTEYRISAEDLHAELGEPVLPVIDALDEESESSPAPLKAPPRQLA